MVEKKKKTMKNEEMPSGSLTPGSVALADDALDVIAGGGRPSVSNITFERRHMTADPETDLYEVRYKQRAGGTITRVACGFDALYDTLRDLRRGWT